MTGGIPQRVKHPFLVIACKTHDGGGGRRSQVHNPGDTFPSARAAIDIVAQKNDRVARGESALDLAEEIVQRREVAVNVPDYDGRHVEGCPYVIPPRRLRALPQDRPATADFDPVKVRLAVVVVWLIGTTVPIGYLMAKHLAPLPSAGAPKIGAAWGATRQEGWQAIHILATECVCSRGVVAHLEKRGLLAGVHEQVWLIGQDTALTARLTGRGFGVQSYTADAVERMVGVVGVPWLVFVSPQNQVAYAGGYLGQLSDAGGYLDAAIWRDIRQGQALTSQPVFGCPTSEALKRRRDPLALKALALADGRNRQ